jgi:heme exporter protein A
MAVRLHNLSHRFGGRWVLSRLSVAFPAHSAVLLTGANGAGKTTLLRIVATSLQPTRGQVELFGLPVLAHRQALRHRLGLVTHASHLYNALTAEENLQLTARLAGIGLGASGRNIPALLERVGLGAHRKRPVAGFSAGMTRRLGLAKLLLQRPELVLLDEPFGQLDADGVQLAQTIVGELRGEGATVVMSTHDIARGRALCDHHLALTHGRQQGPLRAIAKVPRP